MTALRDTSPGGLLEIARDVGDNSASPFLDVVGDIPLESDSFDLVGILSAVQETAYRWDMSSDGIEWECNSLDVLGARSIADIATGTGYRNLIADEHRQRRQDAIARSISSRDGGIGARYDARYRFLPHGLHSSTHLWLEERGRCWIGADGRPTSARGVIRIIDDGHWKEQRLRWRCDHDELTGQLNRARLIDALAAVIGRAKRNRRSCAFLIATVDNLAAISESFGFGAGDDVVAVVGRVIRSRLRGGDTIGRFSSNKFGIILNDCGPSAMRIAAERLIRSVREAAIDTTSGQLAASITIGGVLLPAQAGTVPDALGHASRALGRAKRRRHDNFMAFDPSQLVDEAHRRNGVIASDVVAALRLDRMLIALQPIVCASTRETMFYEALLRLQKSDGSLVPATDFVPLAEQIGLARHIDRRTLELSASLLRQHPGLRLSVNISGLTVGDAEWLALVRQLADAGGELTKRLTIEVTETAVIHDLEASAEFVDTLKSFGCRIAIDDFGAGYTSFTNLKVLDVDMVKIDGSFVANLVSEPANNVFIKTLREIAGTFGMETVAEWVGDAATAEAMSKAGITYLQGYHFGEPVLASDLLGRNARVAV